MTSEIIDAPILLGFSTPPFPKKFAKNEIFKYGSMHPALVKETPLVKKYLGKKLHCAPEQIQFYPGSSQAFFQILGGITDPGDTVAIESPVYDPFTAAASFLNLKILRFIRHRDSQLDFAWHRQNAKQVKILCISNPHCPTGWMYSEEQLDELSQLYRYVLVDEVFLPRFAKGRLTLVTGASRKNVISINGLSKTVGLGQLRFGFSAAPTELVQGIKSMGNLLHIEVPAPSVVGAFRAFKMWPRLISEIEKGMKESRPLVKAFARRHPGLLSHDFASGHFAVMEVPAHFSSAREFVADLLKDGIHVRPCDQFEMPRHIRFHIFLSGRDMQRVLDAFESRF